MKRQRGTVHLLERRDRRDRARWREAESVCITANRWREEWRGERDKAGRMRDGKGEGRRESERGRERGDDTVCAW